MHMVTNIQENRKRENKEFAIMIAVVEKHVRSQLIKSILQNSKEAPELEALGTTGD